MRKNKYFILISFIFIVFTQIGFVQANLLISPTRLTLNDRQRSEELILINSGDETRSYRLVWEEKALDANGNLKVLSKEESKNHSIASPMIRLSPKQVTLKPGGRQIIKISARRPKDLKEGEYRSYLKLVALPSKQKKKDVADMSVKIRVVLSYSLPVVIRKGSLKDPELSITDVSLQYKKVKQATYIEKEKLKAIVGVQFERSGLYYSNGNLIVRWQGAGELEERIVSRVHDVVMYPESLQHKSVLTWDDMTKANGTLRVTFEGIKKHRGEILAEKVITITPDSFKEIVL